MDAGGREFRFRGDLYSRESTFPLVLMQILVVSVSEQNFNVQAIRVLKTNVAIINWAEVTPIKLSDARWCRTEEVAPFFFLN